MCPVGTRFFRQEALVMKAVIVVVPSKEKNKSIIMRGHV
jgi:hypothetical protein